MICSGSGAANDSTKSHSPLLGRRGDELAGAHAHALLDRGHRLRGERPLHEEAQLGVARIVEDDHRAEEVARFGDVVGQRDAARRAEDVRLATDGAQVLVAGDRPEAGALRRSCQRVQLGVEGDGAAVAERGEGAVALVEWPGPELGRAELDVIDGESVRERHGCESTSSAQGRSDGHASGGHQRLGLGDGVLAEVEDRCRQHGVGAALDDAVDEVVERPDAAAGDHRHADGVDDRARQLEVEALPCAVAVHRRQQDLARPAARRRRSPRRRRRRPSACDRRAGRPRSRRRRRRAGAWRRSRTRRTGRRTRWRSR